MRPSQPVGLNEDYLNGDLDWDFDPGCSDDNLDCLVEASPFLEPQGYTPMDFPYTSDSAEDLPFVNIYEANSFGCSVSSDHHTVKTMVTDDSTDHQSLVSESSQESLDQIFRRVQRPAPVKRATKTGVTNRRLGWKKPKDMPKRYLSAYNIFFQAERKRLHEEESGRRLGFSALGKFIGQRWRSLPDAQRQGYEMEAAKDITRYRREMEVYENARRRKFQRSTEIRARPQSLTVSSFTRIPSPSRISPPLRPVSAQYSPDEFEYSPDPVYSQHSYSSYERPQVVVPEYHYEQPQMVASQAPPPPHQQQPQYQQHNNVQYACYRMTRQEADDYMRRYGSNGATVQNL
jgi:structure-specific recognition protein 1